MKSKHILVYVPLHEELREVQKVFAPTHDLTERIGYMAFEADAGDYKVRVVSKNTMGVSAAQQTISDHIDEFDPSLVVCLGICGAISSDPALTDICFGQEVWDITENQKIEKGKTEFRPRVFDSNNHVDARLGLFTVHLTLVDAWEAWRKRCLDNATAILTELGVTQVVATAPSAFPGPIVCGPVLADNKVKQQLAGINRKSLAIETEATGAYLAKLSNQRETIVIRGVSDLADSTKKLTEGMAKNGIRAIAAFNAAAFLEANLLHNKFLHASLSSVAQLNLPLDVPVDPTVSLLVDLENSIDASIRELSPEYRAIAKGYVLPVPRVRQRNSDEKREPALEPGEIFGRSRQVLLEVPATYPDRALPWLVARSLLGRAAGGKVIAPIVLDSSSLSPPKQTIAAKITEIIGDRVSRDEVTPVLIFNAFEFSRDRKSTLLLAEVESTETLCIIFHQGLESSYVADSKYDSWSRYNLCDVSFSSIVNFVSSNFSIENREAEVIAVRLNDTFRTFNVPAHPSYFAGIPKEMLSRLADANHRAELIELAVTGFLSFFSAGETAEVHLKQRTRRLFLRELAYQMVVEKQQFSLSGLVEYVVAYAKHHDFQLEAIEFIQSFMTNGILHQEGEHVVFTIPFIRNYLIAEQLANRPEVARELFNPEKNEVDFQSFELYAEIGLSPEVLDDVIARLNSHISSFKENIGDAKYVAFLEGGEGSYKSSGHQLTANIIKPKLLSNLKKTKDHQERLTRVAGDLLGAGSDLETKQELIDISNEARIRTKAQQSPAQRTNASRRSGIMRDWEMAVVLLGAAAEELSGDTKRKVAAAIVKLASLICDDWLSQLMDYDFDAIKDDMRQRLREKVLEKGEGEEDANKIDAVAETVVDIVEMGIMSFPFDHLVNGIVESGRNPVLFESIRHLIPDDSVQELFLSLWKLELNETKGLISFRETLTKLPKDAFLRMVVASYLIYRAFWFRATESGRKVFVTASDETLAPLRISLSKEGTADAITL